jgi:hypothetical protein
MSDRKDSPYSSYIGCRASEVVKIASESLGDLAALAEVIHQCRTFPDLKTYNFESFSSRRTAYKIRRLLCEAYSRDTTNTRGLVFELLVLWKLRQTWPGERLKRWVLFSVLADVLPACSQKSVDIFAPTRKEAIECKASLFTWLGHMSPCDKDIYCFDQLQKRRFDKLLLIVFATLDPSSWGEVARSWCLDAGFVPDKISFYDQFPL